MWGCYKGRISVVEELLESGANPNIKADHHMSPLLWAAGRGHLEIVEMLLESGAKVNTTDKVFVNKSITLLEKYLNLMTHISHILLGL